MRYSNRLLRGLVFIASILLFVGCDPGEREAVFTRVTSIDPPKGAEYPVQTLPGGGYEGDRPSLIRVEFSKALRGDTVNSDSIEVTMRAVSRHVERGTMYGEPRTIEGNVSYDPTTQSATFQPVDGEFAHVVNSAGFINSEFTIQIRGAGPTPIIDEDGLILDGDGDGREGCDFESSFVIQLGPY